MNRKAPWIAVMAFSAFSVGAIAADGDSMRTKPSAAEETMQGSPAPGAPVIHGSDAVSPSYETQATDGRANSRYETRAPSHPSSSAREAANAPSFAQADRDGNGVLDPAEANAAGINFTAANQDEDGVISPREYYLAVAQMVHEPPKDRS